MPSYLYGLILPRDARGVLEVPGVTGLFDAPVRVIECGPVAALVSDVEGMPARSSLDHIRAHDETLRAVVQRGLTVAASRFGQTFTDDADACRDITERSARVAQLLEEHDGCVEMRVLIALADLDAPAVTATATDAAQSPGRAYLEQLRARAAGAADRVARVSLAAALGPTVRRERAEPLPNDAGVVLSHLVRREDIDAYRAAIAELPALADARVVGPLPLYSFADE